MGFGNDFLHMTSKAQATTEKTSKRLQCLVLLTCDPEAGGLSV
jgi:hypothetical protein